MVTNLSDLVASRICHDLISPIGALNNGLELVRDAGGVATEELKLIDDCASAASVTLKFMRLAFGAASDTHMIAADDAATLARHYMEQKRVRIDWPTSTKETSRSEVKARCGSFPSRT